jgi:N6-adenosine-specific RNA methylase IME4
MEPGQFTPKGEKMQKFGLIVADPPWSFDDKLTYAKKDNVVRGADAKYPTLSPTAIADLPIGDLAAENSLLALWVPSSQLLNGLHVMEAWGFQYKQLWIWAKTHKNDRSKLAFGMGRLARNCHEPCLVGVKGKYTKELANRSQRNIFLHPSMPHSSKPEELQNSLEKMFPDRDAIELFARRNRPGWTCVGNEAPATLGEDIRDSLSNLTTDHTPVADALPW